jgi:glycosyltransferase involved in cell wall biosynthesis
VKIRILQIVAGLSIGNPSGGAEYFALRLARLLDRAQFETAIYALWAYGTHEEKQWRETLEADAIRVLGLNQPTGSIPSDLWAVFKDLWQTVTRVKPHILHSHSERGDLLNALIHSLHPLHPKSVRTVHLETAWVTQPFAGILLEKLVFPLVFDRETAVSQSIQSALQARRLSRWQQHSVALTYNGIDAGIFTRTQNPALPGQLPAGLESSRPRLGIIGRLTAQKGHIHLLEAIHSIVPRCPVDLFIIGTGDLDGLLREKCCQLALDDHVHFLGSRSDVLSILPFLDILISSSIWEGFPTVILEAMALRVPVIATDVSGSRELVRPGESGLLVPPADAASLAQAILYMLEHPQESRRMAQNSFEKASQYTMQRTAEQLMELYRNIVPPAGFWAANKKPPE